MHGGAALAHLLDQSCLAPPPWSWRRGGGRRAPAQGRSPLRASMSVPWGSLWGGPLSPSGAHTTSPSIHRDASGWAHACRGGQSRLDHPPLPFLVCPLCLLVLSRPPKAPAAARQPSAAPHQRGLPPGSLCLPLSTSQPPRTSPTPRSLTPDLPWPPSRHLPPCSWVSLPSARWPRAAGRLPAHRALPTAAPAGPCPCPATGPGAQWG